MFVPFFRTDAAYAIRRSSRSKRHRNDTILKISSDDTVKDIKLKLMNIYSVSPMDQHLIFNVGCDWLSVAAPVCDCLFSCSSRIRSWPTAPAPSPVSA